MAGTRILALDPGTKRIGVALSDELGWTAQPLETYERRSAEADMKYIQQLVREHDVREVVVGLPIRMDGQVGPSAEWAQQFMNALAKTLTIPIVAWDERLTTKAAERVLLEADVSRRKRRGAVNRVAAAIMLQNYLEHQASGERKTESQQETAQ
ncbi:MAG: Holliday junction resolvase RuvX [Nitrospiraceae bacterium]